MNDRVKFVLGESPNIFRKKGDILIGGSKDFKNFNIEITCEDRTIQFNNIQNIETLLKRQEDKAYSYKSYFQECHILIEGVIEGISHLSEIRRLRVDSDGDCFLRINGDNGALQEQYIGVVIEMNIKHIRGNFSSYRVYFVGRE